MTAYAQTATPMEKKESAGATQNVPTATMLVPSTPSEIRDMHQRQRSIASTTIEQNLQRFQSLQASLLHKRQSITSNLLDVQRNMGNIAEQQRKFSCKPVPNHNLNS